MTRVNSRWLRVPAKSKTWRDDIEGAGLLREIVDISVVFLTAQGDQETRARAQLLNPASYLRKPVGSQQIVAAVESALGRPHSNQ